MPFSSTDVVVSGPTASGGTAIPPPFRGSAPSASPESTPTADDKSLWFEPSGVGQAVKTVVPPVVNMLDFPIRDLSARLVAAVRAGLPTDDASRENFYKEYDKSLPFAALPEYETGKDISKVLSFPGQMVGAGAEKASKAVLGDKATATIAPYAGAIADVAPLALGKAAGNRAGLARTVENTPTPQALAARASGYKLPPEEIMPHPSLVSRLLAGEGGKVKRQQDFSQANQPNITRLAAESIGLPPNTRINEAALDRAMQPAERVYSNLTHSVPDTVLAADPAFHQAIANVGIPSAELARYFPEATKSPGIQQLRDELSQNLSAPTDVVRRKIAALRMEAGKNYKKPNDAEAHALGAAQRQGADALEDAIERSITYGPKMVDTLRDWAGAGQAVEAAKADIAKATATGLPAHPSLTKNLTDAQLRQHQYDQQLRAQHNAITSADVEKARVLVKAFTDARQLFAKIYDVRDATNMATGDVIASRVAALRRTKNRPLTGGLKDIADFSDAFPKQSQSPAAFGHAEDWSVLDLIAGGGALAAGHPAVAAGVAGRLPARRILKSEPMQRRMFNRPLPLTNPSSAALYGTVGRDTEDSDQDPLAGLLRESDTLRGIGR